MKQLYDQGQIVKGTQVAFEHWPVYQSIPSHERVMVEMSASKHSYSVNLANWRQGGIYFYFNNCATYSIETIKSLAK